VIERKDSCVEFHALYRCARWSAAAALALLAGCATNVPKGPPLTGDLLIDGPQFIQNGPPRDKVWWEYRTALAALDRGQYDTARPYLDEAITRLNGVFGQDADAKKARGLFTEEAKKGFIGEPYERSMAYYYRGIIYWHDGEPDNARACFRSAEFMDSDTEEKSYAGDYVIADYLDGYITSRLGGNGSDARKRAEASAKLWKPPQFSEAANVFVFVDYGDGPKKYASGQYGQQLRFRCAGSPIRSALVKIDQATGKAAPYDDLCFQATTRGGRVMDHVLANKAVFKTTTSAVGDAAIISGAILSANRDTQAAGLAVLGVGLVSKFFSAATSPQADTRMWDNLPQYLSFVAFEVPPGSHTMTVEFLDASSHALANLAKTIHFTVPENRRDTVIYVSDRSVTPQNL
jgi:tetratricopeptide (TPR) repeat protein